MRRPLEPKQYTSLTFTQALTDERIAGSIGSVGDALDNALMESTIGLFKLECIGRRDRAGTWTGRAEVETATAEWVAWYNTTRLHSKLDHMPPAEFEDRYRATTTAPPRPEVA